MTATLADPRGRAALRCIRLVVVDAAQVVAGVPEAPARLDAHAPDQAGTSGCTGPPITCAVVCTVTRPAATSPCRKSRNAVNLAGVIA
jgi:hypothetical protein